MAKYEKLPQNETISQAEFDMYMIGHFSRESYARLLRMTAAERAEGKPYATSQLKVKSYVKPGCGDMMALSYIASTLPE